MNSLTTIASIPQGGGCASKLPAEVATLPEVEMRSAYFQEQLDEETPLVWPAIDLGVFGGEG